MSYNKIAPDGIKIGVIGPVPMIEKMERTLQQFPTFVPTIKAYHSENEAALIAKQMMDQVEVLLFTGPFPYRIAQKQIQFSIPTHYIPLSGSGLYRAFYKVLRDYGQGLQKISIDTLSRRRVESALHELGEEDFQLTCYDGVRYPTHDELFDFHVENYRSGRSSVSLTGLRSVAEALSQENIPNEWLYPTEQDIVVTLERALLSTESRKNKETQTVVGLIHFDNFAEMADRKNSEHEVQRLKLDIHRTVLSYIESIDGYISHQGGEEYSFITTRGIFEKETGGYKYIPLAYDIKKKFDLSLSIGIGFGRSANEAGTHARIALRRCRDSGGNVCFILREDKGMIGPLEMTQPSNFDLSLIDADVVKKAEAVGFSSSYLSKLVVHMSRAGKTNYNATDLANVLGVTIRSTHRFLNALLDANLIDIVGEEKGKSKGRPKQIYRMTFVEHIIQN